jgi:hypothetical protein
MARAPTLERGSQAGSFHFWKSPEIPWESLKRHVRFYGASAENPELQEPNPHDYETDIVAWSRAQAQVGFRSGAM